MYWEENSSRCTEIPLINKNMWTSLIQHTNVNDLVDCRLVIVYVVILDLMKNDNNNNKKQKNCDDVIGHMSLYQLMGNGSKKFCFIEIKKSTTVFFSWNFIRNCTNKASWIRME